MIGRRLTMGPAAQPGETELAVRVLHTAYGLDAADEAVARVGKVEAPIGVVGQAPAGVYGVAFAAVVEKHKK